MLDPKNIDVRPQELTFQIPNKKSGRACARSQRAHPTPSPRIIAVFFSSAPSTIVLNYEPLVELGQTMRFALYAALLLPSLASATTYNLLHRISTFDSSPEWSLRGTLELPSAPTAGGSNASAGYAVEGKLSSEDVAALREKAYAAEAQEQWYSLAISERDSQEVQLQTSIKLCHLRQSHPDLPTLDDEIILTLRGPNEGKVVTGLSYRVLDIALDASGCPVTSAAKLNAVKEAAKKERQRQLARRSTRGKPPAVETPEFKFNTKVALKEAMAAPRVGLRQAMPTNEDGSVKVPEKEKTLLQKYWYYAIPIVILLIMPPGEDERKQGAEGHQSSEVAGRGMGAKQIK